MTLPVKPMLLPKDLSGQPNGQLDPSLMVSVGPSGSAHHLAARAFKALQVAAGGVGLPITYTFGGCYRSYSAQLTLFRQRYTTGFIAGQPRKWWNGQWWYLRKGMATAAVPGTSNHGWGLAIDAAFDRDPSDGLGPDDAASIASHPQFKWFVENVDKYGFSFELQSEPWHIRYVAGDAIPEAVKAFEANLTPTFPPFDPVNGLYSLWPIASKPSAKFGDRGDHVLYLQGVLKNKASQVTSMDGYFGPLTETAVKNLQSFFGLTVDGWVGAQTWSVVDLLATN